MDELILHFEKISAIIQADCNCLYRATSYNRMIENFYNIHFNDLKIDKSRETELLTTILKNRLKIKIDEVKRT
jgi:hypothetical protein